MSIATIPQRIGTMHEDFREKRVCYLYRRDVRPPITGTKHMVRGSMGSPIPSCSATSASSASATASESTFKILRSAMTHVERKIRKDSRVFIGVLTTVSWLLVWKEVSWNYIVQCAQLLGKRREVVCELDVRVFLQSQV